jgi:exodeoxyribonuclease V alpha subunit
MQPVRTSTATEVLAGLVERVTFHNAENGFCVLRVKARGQRELITVLGHAAMISAGEFVQASGSWINDRTHGVQFKASFLKAAHPTTIEGIAKYLGSELGGPAPPGKYPEPDLGEMLWGLPLISAIARPR